MPRFRVTWQADVDAVDEAHAIQKAKFWIELQGEAVVERLDEDDDDG